MSVKMPEYRCVCCGVSYEVGNGRYPVRPVKAWANALICDTCRSANWDGIVPSTYPMLQAHLTANNIQPVENTDGWWPIPG